MRFSARIIKMTAYQDIQLPQGIKGQSLFNSKEQQRRFEEEFTKAVSPTLREYALARAKSEEDARHHLVD